MSVKGISMVASNGHFEEGSGRVPNGNGLMAPATKFKQRKVSAVRDFLPGCSRVAIPIVRPSGQATIDSSSQVIGSRYYRSTETIHRYYRVVLKAILKLYKLVIRLPDESTPSEIRNNPRFYPYFKDCIGALDGTHVCASIPLSIQGRFRSRKRGMTQNVLAAITFDLRFSYVLAGWEGSAYDSRILSDALSHPIGLRISEGKYYLTVAGYSIRNGYITPYCSVQYHLKEFSAQGPENAKELFNLRHYHCESLLNVFLGF
ncbi:hypothetical protein J1N35_008104 [Gossypium stocksii]|uniref:DDE Tnp4 domain-containing protein n=1 Tax=Gossypium stocksii TaxID=47602 RepID=A0A9D3W7Q8_9ROSI|nr:hypothetical protein J1N35_008104 [Gossypium stocksii]